MHISRRGFLGALGAIAVAPMIGTNARAALVTKPHRLSTIADLCALRGPTIGTVACETLGYYKAGDGGGGSFYWAADSIEPDDRGFTFLPVGQVGPGRWKRVALTDVANVRDFGAKLDGITNDTKAVQAAINASYKVYFPAGTCLTDMLTLRSGSELYGDGTTSIIKQNTIPGNSYGTLYANGGSTTQQIANITIRNLQVLGQVASLGFYEWHHLISLHGVKDVLIDTCLIKGFRGDGIYFGAGLSQTAARHNINATVRNCVFDGINSNNRNGISVIDGDGVQLTGNTFRNCSRSDMPGPIDFEPDWATSVVRNIYVENNSFESYSGASAISVFVGAAGVLTTPIWNIQIRGNTIRGGKFVSGRTIFIQTPQTISSSTPGMGILIENNTIEDTLSTKSYPLRLNNVKGVIIRGNTFTGGSAALVPWALTSGLVVSAMDIEISNNRFVKNGNKDGALVFGGNVANIIIDSNTFEQPNAGTVVTAISFVGSGYTSTSSRVCITSNSFIKGASQTTTVRISNHTLSPTTNYYDGNTVTGGTLANDFRATGTASSCTRPTPPPISPKPMPPRLDVY